MTQFADLIATSLLPNILMPLLFVAVVLGVTIRFLRNL